MSHRALGRKRGVREEKRENRNRVPDSLTLAPSEKAPCCFAQLPASCQVAKDPGKVMALESAIQLSVYSAINKE